MRNGGMSGEESLDLLIIALCADYQRRKEVIEKRCALRRTDTEFRYLNFKIYDATAEIVGERLAEIFIYEIGNRVGYAKSEIDSMSESTYKIYKKRVKDNLSVRLHLKE